MVGVQVGARCDLSGEEEAVVVAFRRHTLLPLDDCLYALQPTIPHLTRSSLFVIFSRSEVIVNRRVRLRLGLASPSSQRIETTVHGSDRIVVVI